MFAVTCVQHDVGSGWATGTRSGVTVVGNYMYECGEIIALMVMVPD